MSATAPTIYRVHAMALVKTLALGKTMALAKTLALGKTLALALIAGLALTACGRPDTPLPAPPPAASLPASAIGGPSHDALSPVQIFRRGNGTEPETLDPHRATGVESSNILRDLYEGLITETADGTLVGGAAQSWTLSDDGRTYTFRLDPEGRWSNGDRVTAEDFVSGFRRSADPATLSEYSAMLYPIGNAEAVVDGTLPPEKLAVRALDDLTLEIRLHSPTPYFLGLLTHASAYPVHRASLARHGDRFTRPGNLVGNGAFVLDEWVVQSHIRLVRNPYYRDRAGTTLTEVWYYPVDNAESELNRYRAGELDMTTTVPNRQLDGLRANLRDELRIAPYFGSYVYGFNLREPPFRDAPDLRKALALAIDRDILTARINGAGELPAYAWVPPLPGYAGYVPEWSRWTQEKRNAEARRLYARAGYSADKPLRMQLLHNTDVNHRRLAVAMAAMWREVLGVQTEIVNQEWQVFLQTRRTGIDTQLFRFGWIGDYADPYTFAEILESKSGLNDMGYSSPRYDALLAQAAREGDAGRRMALLAEAEAVMLDDMPILPIYYYVSKKLVKPWVRGFETNVMDRHHSRYVQILAH